MVALVALAQLGGGMLLGHRRAPPSKVFLKSHA